MQKEERTQRGTLATKQGQGNRNHLREREKGREIDEQRGDDKKSADFPLLVTFLVSYRPPFFLDVEGLSCLVTCDTN